MNLPVTNRQQYLQSIGAARYLLALDESRDLAKSSQLALLQSSFMQLERALVYLALDELSLAENDSTARLKSQRALPSLDSIVDFLAEGEQNHSDPLRAMLQSHELEDFWLMRREFYRDFSRRPALDTATKAKTKPQTEVQFLATDKTIEPILTAQLLMSWIAFVEAADEIMQSLSQEC